MKKILLGLLLFVGISQAVTIQKHEYDFIPYIGANSMKDTDIGYRVGFRLYQEKSLKKSGFMIDASYSHNDGKNNIAAQKLFSGGLLGGLTGMSDIKETTLQALAGYHLTTNSFPIYMDIKAGYSINNSTAHVWDTAHTKPSKDISENNNGAAYGVALGYVNIKNIDFNLGYTATKDDYDSAYLVVGYEF